MTSISGIPLIIIPVWCVAKLWVPAKNDVSILSTKNYNTSVEYSPFYFTVRFVQSNYLREVLSFDGLLRGRLDIPVTDCHRFVDQFNVPRKNHVGQYF